jgi:hypothetical protein
MENNNQQRIASVEGIAQKPSLDHDMELFFGKNANYYSMIRGRRDSAGKVRNTWNGAAFFFSLFWILYRKMYWQFAVYLLIVVVLTFATLATHPVLVGIPGYLMSIVLSAIANRMYLAKAERKVAALGAKHPASDDREAQLVRSGGTNVLGVCVLLIVTIGPVAAALLVPYFAGLGGRV